MPATVVNDGTISFTGGAGYTGGEASRLVNSVQGVLNFDPATRIDALSCCTNPDKIVNEGGAVNVGATGTDPAAC